MNRIVRAAALLLCLIAAGRSLRAQDLSILEVDASGFPEMRARFFATNADGSLAEPTPSEIALTDNGVVVSRPVVTCAPLARALPLSSVLVIDISGSMQGTRLDIARAGARAWVDALAPGRSECAVVSFDDRNYLDQDLTTDRALLYRAIDNLEARGGTSYDHGLLLPPAGGLQVTARGRHRRVIVFLTDGLSSSDTMTAAIIAEAKRQNCVIYPVALQLHCPLSLREIARQTGGEYFDQVRSVEGIERIYRMIALREQKAAPCEVSWRSNDHCFDGTRTVTIGWKGAGGVNTYRVDSTRLRSVAILPSLLHLTPAAVGATVDTTIVVSSVAGEEIRAITSSNPLFTITPSSFTLDAGRSIELTVRYTPRDSSYQWTRFSITGESCDRTFDASAGFSRSVSPEKTLAVMRPNGGEIFVAGSDTVIRWSGIPAGDRVRIDYTTDDGATWIVVTDDARGGSYRWRVPRTPSPICRVRVSQSSASEQESWVRSAGSGRYDRGLSVVVDRQGNSFVGGLFMDTLQIGNRSLISTGNVDGYIASYNPSGELRWVIPVNGGGSDQVTGLALDESGDLIVAGLCGPNTTIGSFPISSDDPDPSTFVAKLGPDGRVVWAKGFGALHLAIDVDRSGEICLAGTFTGNNRDFGGIALSTSGSGLFLARLRGDGSAVWARTIGSVATGTFHRINRLRVDSDGSIIVIGEFHGALDFSGERLLSAGDYDMFLARLTVAGDLAWVRSVGGIGFDVARGLAIDSTGSIYIGGMLYGEVLFDRIVIPADPGLQMFLAKYHPDGSVEWAFAMASDHPSKDRLGGLYPGQTVDALAIDRSGNLLVGGSFEGTSNMRGIQITDRDHRDFYVARFRPDGSPLWIKRGGGVNNYEGGPDDITVAPDGAIFVTGGFANSAGPALFDGDTLHAPQQVLGWSDAYLWKIVTAPLIQTDISDATFSIVIPEGEGKDIHLGRVLIGETRDSVFTAFLRNTGSYLLTVDSITIEGPNAAVFGVVSTTPIVVEPGGSAAVEFRYRPNRSGTSMAKIVLGFGGDTLHHIIRGEGVLPIVAVVNESIDFGRVFIGSRHDTVRALTVTNRSNTPVTITAIRQEGPNSGDFTLLSGSGAVTLQSRDTLRLDLRFAPGSTGHKSDRLTFEFDGFGSPAEVMLFGEAVTTTPASAALSAPAFSARAGEEIELPVTMRDAVNLEHSGATSVMGTLRFNASLLYPIGQTPEGSIVDGERIIDFELPLPAESEDILGRLRFIALLGNDSTTAVTFDNAVSIGGAIALTSASGEFRLLDLCYAGGARLFNPDGQTSIVKARVDRGGSTGEVEIETIESGRIRVALVDLLGREVMVLSDGERMAGRHRVEMTGEGLSSGGYFVVLTTPTVRRVAMVVVR